MKFATLMMVAAVAATAAPAADACPKATGEALKLQQALMKTAAGKKLAAAAAKAAKAAIPAAETAVKTATTALDKCYTDLKPKAATTAAEKADAIKADGGCAVSYADLKDRQTILQAYKCTNSGSDSESSDDEERHHSDNNKPIFIDGKQCPVPPAAERKIQRALAGTAAGRAMARAVKKQLPGDIIRYEAQIKASTVGLQVCHAKNKAVTDAEKDQADKDGGACYVEANIMEIYEGDLQGLRCQEAQNKQQSEHHGHHYSTSWRVNWRSVGWAAISCITVGGGVVATTKMMATFNENEDDLYHVDRETA